MPLWQARKIIAGDFNKGQPWCNLVGMTILSHMVERLGSPW